MSHRSAALTLLLAVLLASGCSGQDVLLGSGAVIGGAALQDRGVTGAASDYGLRLAINDALFKASVELFERTSLMISKGDVVMVGRVPTEAMRLQAEQLAHKAGAMRVTNCLTVGENLPWRTKLQDSMISNQLEANITFDRDVSALNYDIETRAGVVYLMGEARSEAELRRVRYLAEQISGVQAVQSYVHVPTLPMG